jgi:2,4-dienoyl-CoA reductase-like NADH-dependent reductase (Old Yellow Enzyme family)/glycerol-3-phosphate dehydrogenase
MAKLFEKTKIGSMELKNRIVMAPMGSGLPNVDGTVSEQLIDYCVRRAVGGAALIVVEYCSPDPEQFLIPTELRLTDDKYISGLSVLARAIKDHGARAALQLMHPGRGAMSMFTGNQPVAPSPILFDWPFLEQPRELTSQDIDVIVERFAEAARRAKDAGFDAVEIHGAHGHLVAQFLSPHTNKRNDKYGRDTYGRARFAVEIVRRTRAKVGPDFPIWFRISGDEYIDGGVHIEESKIIAKLLEEAGVDALSVSAGVYPFSLEWIIQPALFPTGCLAHLSAEIKKSVKIPVMVAGRINSPKLAETIVEEGKADLIVMGRALLVDPDLPLKAQQGRYGDIIKCMACNTCVSPERGMGPVRCLMNPELAKEGQTEPKAKKAKTVFILGAGPAGLEAARVASLRGHRVTLWDESEKLGGRWSWMIAPYIKRQLSILKKLGVSIELGKHIGPKDINKLQPDALIVTLNKKVIIPKIRGIKQKNVVLADDVLDEKVEIGRKAVILGAGNVGFEVAQFLSRKGIRITIVDEGNEIGYGMQRDFGKVLLDRFRSRGIKILTSSQISRIKDNTVFFKDIEGIENSIEADSVILALGSEGDPKTAESLKNYNLELFTVNYCDRPDDVYKSTQEGASIAREI